MSSAEQNAPTQTSKPPAGDQRGRGWRFWVIMTSMSVSSLLAALDASAVSTAMPSIIKDLGASQAYMWIANAYLLTMTAFTPLFGRVADMFGRRIITLLAILLFAIGSAISGPAPNLGTLVAGRAIQGIGAAGLNTVVEVVVCDLVPLRERGKFMGFIFAIYGIGTSIGPVIGGVLAARATWRWVFYINLPLAGLSLLLVGVSLGALPRSRDKAVHSLKRLDISGNVLLVAAITSILLALTWGGGERPWSSWRTLLPLILGLLGLPLFILVESRVSEPTTPLRLFSNRTSFAGFGLTFCHHVLLYWTIFMLPVYFQGVLGASPLKSGVDLLPVAIVTMPFAILSGAILTNLGRYRPVHFAGFILLCITFGLFTRLDQSSTTGYWAGVQILGAAGIGLITTVTLPTILAPLPESDVAVATATWAFMRGFGTIWGAAIPLAVFNSRVNQLATTRLTDSTLRNMLSDGGAYALVSGGSVYSLNSDQKATVQGIYVDSLKLCWQVGLAFALLGFLIAIIAKEVPMRTELETEYGLMQETEKPPQNGTGSEARSEKRNSIALQECHDIDAN
ncbi:hypothetical protein VPNG_04078 [Cytospora leucostoma]|uniref:Major facilitator superfamily (MFS) profile domain-containing protein n=1 Tax=Cytospora leucostoma TaxID=1230097 RepID=A0A423XD75_9PEZI|nr:hypothetical protein VPNG_04078 [Cytospora leucostoma]